MAAMMAGVPRRFPERPISMTLVAAGTVAAKRPVTNTIQKTGVSGASDELPSFSEGIRGVLGSTTDGRSRSAHQLWRSLDLGPSAESDISGQTGANGGFPTRVSHGPGPTCSACVPKPEVTIEELRQGLQNPAFTYGVFTVGVES